MRQAIAMVMVLPVYTWEKEEELKFRQRVNRMLTNDQGKSAKGKAGKQEMLMAVMTGWISWMVRGNNLRENKKLLILSILLCIQGVETDPSASPPNTWARTLALSSANSSTKARLEHHLHTISCNIWFGPALLLYFGHGTSQPQIKLYICLLSGNYHQEQQT